MVKELTLTQHNTDTGNDNLLVLFNDDHNSFDWVIKSLQDVCEHSEVQAEQCAMIVHYKGKYSVLSGPKDDLRPRCQSLLDRGLTAEIQ